jgi:hypothetical protein
MHHIGLTVFGGFEFSWIREGIGGWSREDRLVVAGASSRSLNNISANFELFGVESSNMLGLKDILNNEVN